MDLNQTHTNEVLITEEDNKIKIRHLTQPKYH